jgi:CheY-like chemotaxis protein
VDDDAESRLLLVHFLTENGWRVEEAPDGESGLAAATRTNFDLFLLDLHMPGDHDGMGVVARLRRLPAYVRTPIVCVSGSPQEQTRAAALQAGFSSFFSKPVNLNALLREIEHLLQSP